ncbi:hypothetical protein KC222_00165 [Cedecea davisae]|uniref:TumA n=1 Tax=Cedecea davisae TaxID=158484 RepID=A0ABS6DBH3_9ENTR|nr:hypothetical protein [Cedecea davisae]MBU4680427.1 hypothetical protein [Cedecea davisae]MBU4684919.1 hypothetical protein [Cedecea davisae]
MVGEQFSQTQHKLACVQFIAEISLIANCKPADLKLAMSIIADLADSGSRELKQESNIYYEAK